MNDVAIPAVQPLALILGLGETGVAAARWCARAGTLLRIADTRAQPSGVAYLRSTLPDDRTEYLLGGETFAASLLDGVSQVVISPGLSPLQEPAASLIAAAAERGIEVIGEIELFARALADLEQERGYRPKVLAITGTNGKTTVTALTRHLVEAAGLSARAAGNISPSALTALMDALDHDGLPDVWVLELSSFQLETTSSLAPDAAVVLNVSQDHLDWHGGMAAYAKSKSRLLTRAEIAIVNRDDPLVTAMVESLDGLRVRSFGRDLPSLVGDMGLEHGHGVAWLVSCEATEFDDAAPVARRRKNAAPMATPRAAGRVSRLMPVDALRLRGLHNATNVLAALALTRSLGLGWGPGLRAAREYEGEPHRAQFVRSIAGVDFINDSKGTNVGATVAALEGLGQRVVLIAGGLGKGQDFTPLTPAVARHARAVVLIGQDAKLIAAALTPSGVPLELVADLPQAVARALALAQPGDAVLLSPACASMDMFDNYGHRGRSFTDAVRELALDQGEVA
jgi:UDP-N-acetylmuramoylalanine--D-glutamate ligase